MRPTATLTLAAGGLLLLPSLFGCSVRRLAIDSLGDALAQGGSSYARDDDPELVGAAVPFGLKTIEGLLQESPRHRGLLLAAARGFTQYAFAWVQQEADFVEANDLTRATQLRDRARRLYLRAREYGWRGLDVELPGLRVALASDSGAALGRATKKHVPLLHATGLAWFGAIALAKHDSELSADQYQAEALMRRALALDETYERGSIHDFFISWESRAPSAGGSYDRARQHLERALALAGGSRAWPLVAYAESSCVARQDREEFLNVLDQALAVEAGKLADFRLANVLAQRRAAWLRGRAEELFVE
jgi:predicted anti-sigma-YlaC factor YlaD